MALVVVLAALVAIGLVVRPAVEERLRGYSDTRGVSVVRYDLSSKLVGRSLGEVALVPKGKPQGLLVLLHGRNDSGPRSLLSDELFAAIAGLAGRAPVVVLLNGGSHSYYHDRRDGRWGSMILSEAIPDAVERFGTVPGRVAIGGISMGGFGALHLASRAPSRFCAVGAHAAALWRSGGETPAGAFDDAEDYTRTDVWVAARARRYATVPVWIDVGTRDGFRDADVAFAELLREHGTDVERHVWDGSHDRSYWNAHMDEYLAFYARQLAGC